MSGISHAKRKFFLVAGMHRSATSLVAKSLHNQGVHMGDDLMQANAGNPAGYYEDLPFVRLNDQMLAAEGGGWDNPFAITVDTVDKFMPYMVDYLATRVEQGRLSFGVKDPRLCVTAPAWIQASKSLGLNPILVSVWRSPAECARSLVKRDGGDYQKYIMLARRYHTYLTVSEQFYRSNI